MDPAVQRDWDALREAYASLPPIATPHAFEETTEMLPAADGVCLRTMIVRPTGEGPWPTIAQRSCYPHLEPLYRLHAAAYAARGLAYVYQFCRGVGASGGQWVPNVHDRADGCVFLAWLEAQSWALSIGYYGSSYLAFTGWIMADVLPPKVKTLYLTHYGTDRFTSAYQRGLFRQDVLTSWAFNNTGAQAQGDYLTSARYRPQVDVDEQVWQVGPLTWYRDWITHVSRHDAYWNEGFWQQLKDIPSKVTLPVYLGESWYDHHLGSALKTWQDLSPQARAHSTLCIGAWDHGFHPCVDGQPTDHLEADDAVRAFHWFEQILVRGEVPEGRVRYYRVGADAWYEAENYPFDAPGRALFYLTADRALADAPGAAGQLSYRYDPDDPVPTHGAESVLACIEVAGSRLQPPCDWRPDVLSFQSPPLENDMDILGPIKVYLSVASDAEDTAFTAKLMEVLPGGAAYNIRSSITTLAYRDEADADRGAYAPGQVVEAVIDLWDVAWRVKRGSRLRVDISSSDFPQYAAHTNYPGIWSLQSEAKPAKQTLFFGAKHRPRIVIPTTRGGIPCTRLAH